MDDAYANVRDDEEKEEGKKKKKKFDDDKFVVREHSGSGDRHVPIGFGCLFTPSQFKSGEAFITDMDNQIGGPGGTG